jgi:integrase
MARKKRERGNGQGTVAPRRNKQGKIIGYRGAFFGPDGKRHWVSAKNKTECWSKLTAAMTDADRGVLPSSAGNLTVGAYLESWLADIEGTVRRHTYEQYKSVVGKHLIPALGRAKLTDLRRPAIRKLYREKKQSGLKSRTVEYIHVTLHKALNDAVGDRLINYNPTEGLKLPHKDAEETKALSPEQVSALLRAARGGRLEALYVVALHTGLRRGELLALRWDDVDFEKGTLRVDQSLDQHGAFNAPKREESHRTLRLTPAALAALKAHRLRQNAERLKAGERWCDNDLVFPNTVGRPMNPSNLYRRDFQPLLERAGLGDKGFTFNSLRHTFATTLAASSIHPSTAQKMLGHKDIRMTLAIYTHATDDMQNAAVDAISATFS